MYLCKTFGQTLLLASLLSAMPVMAASNWVGYADYTQAPNSALDEEVVGPFDKYDFGTGIVLLESAGFVGSSALYNGFYQSFVTRHELQGNPVLAPLLDSTYELTITASFSETVTPIGANQSSVAVNSGGVVNIYLDTSRDRSFNTDSGFDNGDVIMTGVIQGGIGSVVNFGNQAIGITDLNILITGYDTDVFAPDSITGASSIFTLRLNNQFDASFVDPITSVMSHGYDAGQGDLKLAADGYLALAVPEADQYAFLLLGFAIVGALAGNSRRHPGK